MPPLVLFIISMHVTTVHVVHSKNILVKNFRVNLKLTLGLFGVT
jgi:hypothetical protein